MQKVVSERLIVSGHYVERYQYSYPIVSREIRTRVGRSVVAYGERRLENRERVLARARTSVRRLVDCNPDLNKFFTLTFAENVTDFEVANECFRKYIMRLKYNYKSDLKYLVVPEFQKRGAIHFHVLCNLQYVPVARLAELWGFGFCRINRIDNVTNVGLYVSKYIQKQFDDDRLHTKKCYWGSRNLKRPVVIDTPEVVDSLLSDCESRSAYFGKKVVYQTDMFGAVLYQKIYCKEFIPILEYANRQYRIKYSAMLLRLHGSLPTDELIPLRQQLDFFEKAVGSCNKST